MKPNFIVLVGLPASGKSTYADKLKNEDYIVHSSDAIREELFDNANHQADNDKVFKLLFSRCREDLELGNNVVLDATNMARKKRVYLLSEITRKLDVIKKAIVIATPYNECIDRDKARDRTVGYNVIEKMYKSFQVPCKQEGFEEIDIVYMSDEDVDGMERLDMLNAISQHNKNHTKTIGDHCKCVGRRLPINDRNLYHAGFLHDIGKQFTASFKDSNGKLSMDAHYYSHENVGAYDSLFVYRETISIEDKLDIALLINYHMLPHTLKTEKSIERYKKFFGQDFWDRLMLLHEADKKER